MTAHITLLSGAIGIVIGVALGGALFSLAQNWLEK